MVAFIDSVSKCERVFKCYGKTFKTTMNPEKGLNELKNSIEKGEAEKAYNEVAQFYKTLPKLPGSVVPVKTYEEMSEYIANNPVEKQVPNESVIRDLKIKCLDVMDDIYKNFGF